MTWEVGEYHLDPERFQLTRCGEPVRVEPQVLALLFHLVRNRDSMVTKDEIVASVWQGAAVSDASISSRIRSARQALGDDGTRQAAIRTVHGRGFRFVAAVTEVSRAPLPSDAGNKPSEHPSSRPSIAVVPFQPLGISSDLAVLCEAIPHEIIQALSRLRWLAVIARGSSFRFRQTVTDPGLVASALAARYVVTGVIECPDRKVAVTLELTDTRSREILWADRLVAPLEGIGDLRSEIVAHLVSALEIRVPSHEARIAGLDGLHELGAWASYHVGLAHLYRFTAADTALAQACFERAVAADPHFVRAHAGLSFTSFLSSFLRLTADPAAAADAARRHAERSLELDPLDPFANFNMGRSFWLTGEPEIAAEWLTRATTLNPNYAQGFYAAGFTSMLTGDAPATGTAVDTAIHLSPLDPLLYAMYGVRAQMLIQTEDHDAAAAWADRAGTAPGAHFLIAMIAVVANGLAGRPAQAARWRREVRRLRPHATAADYFAAFPTRHAASRLRVAAELHRQGF